VRALWILPVSVLVAVPTQLLFADRDGGAAVRAARTGLDLHERMDALRERVQALSIEEEGLRTRLAELVLRPEQETPEVGTDTAEIEAAVTRWLAEHALQEEVLEAPWTLAAQRRADVEGLAIGDLLAYFQEHPGFGSEAQTMYEAVREAGRMDELLAAAMAHAQANPNDPEAQVELGMTYLQKLFGIGATPEAGQLAFAADEAFDRALELDPQNLQARFTKAVSLSNWPAFLGKTGEAIEHFEILVRQVEEAGSGKGYDQAYLFLGNMYQRIGENEKALSIWRQGLGWSPENEDLARQIELAEEQASNE